MKMNIRNKFIVFGIIMLLLLCIITAIFLNQRHIVLSRKFYVPIKKDIEILYMDRYELPFHYPYCEAVLKVSDNDFEELLSNMYEGEYYDATEFITKNRKDSLKEWIPFAYYLPIKTSYILYEVEGILVRKRIYAYVDVTESVDGYRYLYLSRN